MKVNLKTTNEAENAAATPNCHQRGQRTVNGIIGNTRRGIVVDKTLDPDSNNPVSNKSVSTALAALVGKIDAALQKPTGLTKTKLVGVGANGQENIEIGDNLTLANGKLSATGGGGGKVGIVKLDETQFNSFDSGEVFSLTNEQYDIIKTNDTIIFRYTQLDEGRDFTLTKNVLTVSRGGNSGIAYTLLYIDFNAIICLFITPDKEVNQFSINADIQEQIYSHFITLSSPTLGNITFNYDTTNNQNYTIKTLTESISGKRVICSGFINYSGTRKIAQYIFGANDKLMVFFYDLSDGSTDGIIIDNTFSISDITVQVY